jgi:hypothetical protein
LGGEDRYLSADGESRSRMLLEVWDNEGKRSWDGFTVKPWLFRGAANGLTMANALSLRLILSPTKLPKDETSDRRKRFLAAEMTKVQCAILNMHTTDNRMGERNSYTSNRSCTEKRPVRHHDKGRPEKFTSGGKMSHTVVTRDAISCAAHATSRRTGKGN